MQEKIAQIRQSLQSKTHLTALALALTLPDICGQVEYPEEESTGEHYRKWFNKYVKRCYTDDEQRITDKGKIRKSYFTGGMCYQLRCAYLHDGNSKIDKQENKQDPNFKLIINGTDSINKIVYDSYNEKKEVKKIKIDVERLCENICIAAENYYNEKQGKGFEEHHIEIIDVTKFRKLNHLI